MNRSVYLVFVLFAIMPATLQSTEESLKALAESSNTFSYNLYKELRGTSGNLVFSPLSAHIALTLAYHGANGTTAEEMKKVLQLPSDKHQVAEGHKTLLTELESPVLKLATKLFAAEDIKIKQDYQAVATDYYLSEVERKDFVNHSIEAVHEINSWVESKTNNKIKDLLPEDAINALTRLVLVNAIHFKAKWATQFREENTKLAPFHNTPNDTVQVNMMALYGEKFNYTHSEKLQAKVVELPYEGKEFSMILIVPDDISGLSAVEDKLDAETMKEVFSSLYLTTVDVKLPKFKLEKTLELNDILISMGMPTAFNEGGADFSGIANESLYISKAIQKAFIEVNEEGTEAAAATGVVVNTKSSIVAIALDVSCDRPFMLYILNKKSNTNLFISRVNEFK